ncbi:MAG: NAD-dependent malic enzyme [Thermus sp.]|uniref:NAD-dependent malic enzyme n=1 Tax=Thermus sp. TaxID=275 RepID=UPI0025DEC6BC|nr:NAD-dependent malic enzyme [Thermus sp.]MCS7217951.1 NAD-dependent malic enzyme [Thermus sp.]MCX7850336.1 NAD-dependent malic enzyme [Thermus sp.]MDW8016429.1 NAD-dependent malic enzyme [Thermus sp.]MDW8357255.1 NAD-dependent malic enzyme [Thermus sp.]
MPVSRYYDVKRDERGERYLEPYVTGFLLLRLPLLNKGTAFTEEERRALGLEGLLPPHVNTLEEQKERVYRRYRLIGTPLEKHIYLRHLQDRNEVLFYALLVDHLEEMLPILYTPTVGEAVREFSHIYRYPRGFTASTGNIQRVEEALANVPLEEVRLIVATDSSAILGIGDQGYGGMAISIGKLTLYTAVGGVGPDKTLPVELDVGTDREDLLKDPLYLGVRHRRLRGEAYYRFLDRFVEAVRKRYPKALIQWEDFAKEAAFHVLERYRKVVPSFNDDIQGTGAVALAGVLSACRLKGERLSDQVVVVYGAGAGGIGVAWALVEGMRREGLSEAEAKARVLVLDSKGLLVEGRSMEAYKRPYAQAQERLAGWRFAGPYPNLLETIQNSRATVLLGLSGQGGSFTEPLVRAMLENTQRPVIFPLSNPTSASEALPDDLVYWTEGRALVAAGSPFPPVGYMGRTIPVGQGNNAFIFPGLGLGAVLARAREVTDGMVLEAAYALYDYTRTHFPELLYPPVGRLREVSPYVAARVMRKALEEGVAEEERVQGLSLEGLLAFVQGRFWEPRYLPYRPAPVI